MASADSFLVSGSLVAIGWSLLSACVLPKSILGASVNRVIVGVVGFVGLAVGVVSGGALAAEPLAERAITASINAGNPLSAVQVVHEMSAGGAYNFYRSQCFADNAACLREAADRADAAGVAVSGQWLLLWCGVSLAMLAIALFSSRVATSAFGQASTSARSASVAFPKLPAITPPSTRTLIICGLGAVSALVAGFAIENMGSQGDDLPSWLGRSLEWEQYGAITIPSPPLWAALGVAVALAISWLRKQRQS
jgi:hypothetical protein